MKAHASIDWASVHARLRASEDALKGSLEPSAETIQRTLNLRAQQLARPHTTHKHDDRGKSLLIVIVDEQRWGMDLTSVVEVAPLRQVARVPGAVAELCGVVCHRGEARSVIDVGVLLGKRAVAKGDGGCLILVRAGNIEARLRVDAIDKTISVQPTDMLSKASSGEGSDRFVAAIHRDGIPVLCLERLCASISAGFMSARPPDASRSDSAEIENEVIRGEPPAHAGAQDPTTFEASVLAVPGGGNGAQAQPTHEDKMP
ncbi:MAG: chemotaxis protein CheW [Phycisphaerales bacterium]